MSYNHITHRLYGRVGLLGKALGQETRLEIIEVLAQCPRTVECIAEILRVDIKSVSAHLKVLHNAGAVQVQRQGRFRRYAVSCPQVVALAVLLRQTAEITLQFTADSEPEFSGKNFKSLPSEEAVALSRDGRLTLIDLRPREEFEAGHLHGALNVPMDELEQNLEYLDKDRVYAAYCRGPYCFLVREAREIFARHGLHLTVIEDGVMEWQSQGHDLSQVQPEEMNEPAAEPATNEPRA